MNSDVEGSSPKPFYSVTTKRRIPTPVADYQTVKDLLTQPDGVSPIPPPVVPLGKKPVGPGKNAVSSDWIKLDDQPAGSPQPTHLRVDPAKYKSSDIFHLTWDQRPTRKMVEAPKAPEEKPSGIRHFSPTPSYDPFHPPTDPVPTSPPAKRMVQLDTSNKGQNSFVPLERQLGQRKRVDKIPGEDTKEPVHISDMPVSSLRSTQLDGFLVRAHQREAKDDFRHTQELQSRSQEARSEQHDVKNLDAWDKAHKRPKEPEISVPVPAPAATASKAASGGKGATKSAAAAAAPPKMNSMAALKK